MRKTVAHLFSSVDGAVDAPFRFQLDSFDEGLDNAMDRNLATVDAMLLGRVLYTEWAEYWPEATDEFGVFVNPLKKYVVSTTLTGPLEWQNSELLTGDPMEAIRALKQTEGGDISVGGITLTRSSSRTTCSTSSSSRSTPPWPATAATCGMATPCRDAWSSPSTRSPRRATSSSPIARAPPLAEPVDTAHRRRPRTAQRATASRPQVSMPNNE